MSVAVFLEVENNEYKKSSIEALVYGSQLAQMMGTELTAMAFQSAGNTDELGKYGAQSFIALGEVDQLNADSAPAAIAEASTSVNASVIILSNSYTGKNLSPQIAVKSNASLATNVISLPKSADDFTVKRGVYSGKAFAHVTLNKDVKVLALTPNSFDIVENPQSCGTSTFGGSNPTSQINVVSTDKVSGKVALTEAEVVISGGRGLKGPENWGMVEEMADLMNGATACSKPVSDMEWRPHSEHVGQTGITIKPNLYIAIGISGAIQHLAGVSSSKTIVVINKDAEAPFFKAADYGIVGDAFEVVPKLISALKA